MALDNAKNFAKSDVSTGYGSGATSIDLVSGGGAKMPTAPFNAVWWNLTDYPDPSDDPNVEIVRVTNVATDTLTITRAQEGTSASNKNTAAKTYRLIAPLTAKVINTDLPAASGLTKAGPYLTDGASYYLAPFLNQVVTPDGISFSWKTTQGTASEAALGKALVLTIPPAAGDNIRFRGLSKGTNTTLVAALSITSGLQDHHVGGLALNDSGGSRLITFGINRRGENATNILVTRWTNATTFSADVFTGTIFGGQNLLWLRIRISGGTLFFDYSFDGVNFANVYSESATAFFASSPDTWGYAGDSNGASDKDGTYLTLLSFQQS